MIVATVTTGHGVMCATNHAVPHALMIVATDAIAVVDVLKIAGETTTVDATKATGTMTVDVTTTGVTAADVTEAGIAATAVTPTLWMRTSPGPAQGTEMTNHYDGLTHAPTILSAPEGVTKPICLTTTERSLWPKPQARKRQRMPRNLSPRKQ